MSKHKTAYGRYDELKIKREPYLQRARNASSLTIPSLIPPQGSNGTNLPEPSQGFGSKATIFLSSRLMAALYPPGFSSFRLMIPPEQIMQSGQEPDEQVEIGLILAETLINAEIERKNWRAPTNMILQHLIVGGNAMEMVTPDNRIRGFRLDQYVVVRDPSGRLLEFVIEEKVFPDNLPPELGITHSKSKDGDTVPLYTWGRFDSKKNR